jgi:colanic acid/amylovoran biosynthesis glycosyltransferase
VAPLKVVYLLLYFPRLTETFIADEIRWIRAQGGDVRIISLLAPEQEPVQPVSQALLGLTWYAPGLRSRQLWAAQLHYLTTEPRLYLSLLSRLMGQSLLGNPATLLLKRLMIFLKAVTAAYYLRSSGVQLVHSHFAWLSGGAAWVCARLLDLPFTVTVHAFDVFSRQRDLLPLLKSEASQVIAISEANRVEVAADGASSAEAISVIHCGVDTGSFNVRPGPRSAGARDGRVRILSVGSLIAKKGHRYLIAACERLADRGVDFTCTIIGRGPEELPLRKQIHACGLDGRVFLRGGCMQSEVIAAYGEHDVFVLSATVAADGDRDGVPVVLMEAGAMGLPLISTPVSGIPELVRHEETGVLVPAEDAVALAEAMASLASDPAKRARLGRNAMSLVQAEFNIEINAKTLARLFHKTIMEWTRAEGERHRQVWDEESPGEAWLS